MSGPNRQNTFLFKVSVQVLPMLDIPMQKWGIVREWSGANDVFVQLSPGD